MSDNRAAHLEAMAPLIEDNQYGYHRVTRELRNLARSTALPPLLAPGWLEEPPVEQAPVANVGND